MVIVHLITGLGTGGAERMLVRLVTAPHSAEFRYVVISLTSEGVYGALLRSAGVDLYSLSITGMLTLPRGIIRLLRLLRKLKPDILMTWLYHADLVGICAAFVLGIQKVIWNLRCSHMEFSNYAITTRLIVAILARLSKRPWAVAANSAAGRWAHEQLGYRPKRWLYLPNGIDLEEWSLDAECRAAVRKGFGFSDMAPVVGFVGRVDPQKGIDTFFSAAALLLAKIPEIGFVMVGRGTEKLDLPGGIKHHFRLLGERTDVQRQVQGFDVLVSASSYGEGFSNVVGEAMAVSIPCVATDVGDSRRLIGDTGLIVPPRDPAALAAATAEMLSMPEEGRRELGRRARSRIAEHWSLPTAIVAHEAIWAQASVQSSD